MVAELQPMTELTADGFAEFIRTTLELCMPECFVRDVKIVGVKDKDTGIAAGWKLVGTCTRKINLGHAKRFACDFDPTKAWTEHEINALITRLVPGIRQAFETDAKVTA